MKDFTSELRDETRSIHKRVEKLTEEQKNTCLLLDSIVRTTMDTQKVEQAILTLLDGMGFQGILVYEAEEEISGPFLLTADRVRIPLETRKDIAGHTLLGYLEVTKKDGDVTEQDARFLNEFTRRTALSLDHAFLYSSLKRALISLREIGSFVQHELKAPIAVALGFEEVLKGYLEKISELVGKSGEIKELSGKPFAKMREMLGEVEFCSDKTHRAVRRILHATSLLDALEIDRQQVHARLQPLTVGTLLDELAEFLEEELKDRPLCARIWTEIGMEDLHLNVDPTYFDRIFDNTLGNAVKYSAANSIIEVQFSRREGRLRFVLTNNTHRVFTTDTLNRLYEKGYRFDEGFSRTKIGANQGLGLYFVNKIVRNGYNGDVRVESGERWLAKESGQDTDFHFRELGCPLETSAGELPFFRIAITLPFEEIC